uniref:Restriction endonuclease n=1 Tax=Rhabditophanes sp. KR3021 TaxID=114890 RepID=A0AC35UHR0_9BILA
MKVRRDSEAQFHMSKVARDGFARTGRGSVNFRINTVSKAKQYLNAGWEVFNGIDYKSLLFYYPIQALENQQKEQSLIKLCKQYNAKEKFILSVSVIAEVENIPETPPNERTDYINITSRGKQPYSPTIINASNV